MAAAVPRGNWMSDAGDAGVDAGDGSEGVARGEAGVGVAAGGAGALTSAASQHSAPLPCEGACRVS